ncbi:helix-turn-helix domain-containing protein [Sphingopyxis flava]|uniref:Helix-turn-helix domain-containing protein n=1 Tax=Sphingopyxis flava TaxID=1507287 RepID=A0A1T5ACQ2_9SPHN|nr:helix-turn-helix transcriptional regulator [Sphingopyxis flava]SKB32710.1 Helix-turn-helix domain-containing protein [Sphingopyxis flava]
MDLRKARQKRGWTLERVAELVGTTPMSVSRHETGQSFPRPDPLDRYLALYHGDVTEEEIRATYLKIQKARAAQAPPKEETVP